MIKYITIALLLIFLYPGIYAYIVLQVTIGTDFVLHLLCSIGYILPLKSLLKIVDNPH